jgi:hypothetical protein
MTEKRFEQLLGTTKHPEGCVWGGFSCGFWLIAPECELEHWERHIVGVNSHCPCGTEYPGAASTIVYFEANSE